MVAATIANVNRAPKSRVRKVRDFIPEWDHRPQTSQQMLATVHQLNRAYGGTVKGVDGDGDS